MLQFATFRCFVAVQAFTQNLSVQRCGSFVDMCFVCMQTFAYDLAGEYVRHFTQQELVIGAEAEARLAKTLIKRVSLADALVVTQEMRSSCSCIVKVEHHTNAVTAAQLLNVCLRSLPCPPLHTFVVPETPRQE